MLKGKKKDWQVTPIGWWKHSFEDKLSIFRKLHRDAFISAFSSICIVFRWPWRKPLEMFIFTTDERLTVPRTVTGREQWQTTTTLAFCAGCHARQLWLFLCWLPQNSMEVKYHYKKFSSSLCFHTHTHPRVENITFHTSLFLECIMGWIHQLQSIILKEEVTSLKYQFKSNRDGTILILKSSKEASLL